LFQSIFIENHDVALAQALVLFKLDYCNALLAGLPACTVKLLQLFQNATARVGFKGQKWAYLSS